MSRYVLVRWQDGHQEVAQLDDAASRPLRYYVVERVERHGRLAIETADGGYPELKVLDRKPGEIDTIAIVDERGGETYALRHGFDTWEGGKTEHHYDVTAMPDAALDGLVREARAAVDALGLDAGEPSDADVDAVRRALGLACLTTQDEVDGFVRMLIDRARAERAR